MTHLFLFSAVGILKACGCGSLCDINIHRVLECIRCWRFMPFDRCSSLCFSLLTVSVKPFSLHKTNIVITKSVRLEKNILRSISSQKLLHVYALCIFAPSFFCDIEKHLKYQSAPKTSKCLNIKHFLHEALLLWAFWSFRCNCMETVNQNFNFCSEKNIL